MRSFPNTSGPTDADLMVVAESWGAEEEKKQCPLVGRSGHELDLIFNELGIDTDSVFKTNIINSRPLQNDMRNFFFATNPAREMGQETLRGLYPMPNVNEGLKNLYEQISYVNPKVILGFGNYALWGLTNDCFKIGDNKDKGEDGYKVPTGIIQWRGSQLETSAEGCPKNVPFVPTIHPAAALRNWPWRRLIKHDIRARVTRLLQSNARGWQEPDYNFIIRPSLGEAIATISELLKRADAIGALDSHLHISVDLETRGYLLACVGIAWSACEAICIPIQAIGRPRGYWAPDEEYEIIKWLQKLFLHPHVRISGQNFLYDMQYIVRELFCRPKVFHDIMIAWRLLWPGDTLALWYQSSMLCKFHKYWKEDGKEWGPSIPEEQLWIYNCTDAVRTWEIKEAQEPILERRNQTSHMYDEQMEDFDIALDMMLEGLPVDLERREQFDRDLSIAIEERENYLAYMIDESIWPIQPKKAKWYSSSAQQAEIFYDVFILKEQKKRKKRGEKESSRSVDDEALERLKKIEPLLEPVFTAIQELRSCKVFRRNFVRARLDTDNKMRFAFKFIPETFRLSCSKNAMGLGANMQAIPRNQPREG